MARSGFREVLHRRVAERVREMPEPEALAWIAGHGLLSMASCESLPAGLRERLRDRGRATASYNLHAVSRFQEAVAALEGLPVCPLKGIHLLDTVYREDPGCRPLGDVDLLVPLGRLDEAVERLEGALGLEELPASRRLRRIYPERVLTGRAFVLELHDRLGYKHGWASSWSDLEPVPARVHGCPVHVLDRETTLVHLVTHLVKHGPFGRLVWVEDMVRWIEDGIDPERVRAISRRIGARSSVIAGVRALRWLLGEEFLAGAEGEIEGPGRLLLRLNERRLWNGLRERPLPAPVAAGGDHSRSGSLLSALLLADRPVHALRIVGVKGAELALRRRVRPERSSGARGEAGR